MNILVYDIAAENGGAVTVLNYFYEQHKKNKENHYYYMLSVYPLEETDNITVINVPYIKKSWLKRLEFDFCGVKKYLKKYKIDEILSLQNTIVPCFYGKQTVYEHNALPFAEYKFTFREDRKMWIYQNILGSFMLSSIKRANGVIVQTEWMKKAIIDRVPSARNKIIVDFPEVEIPKGFQYTLPQDTMFFYPANSSKFKNHKVIIEACQILQNKGISNYSVVFTLHGDETEFIKSLYNISQRENLPIKWIGEIKREEVFKLYSESVLIFPSYIETVGLPIYEAISVGSPVILSNCGFARNIAKDYKNADYFEYYDKDELAKLMTRYVK